MAYSVSVIDTWTTDGNATREFFQSKGATVKPSRTHGDFQVFIEGKMVAWGFDKKVDQMSFLKQRGLI